jgi:hypothetical protein
MKVVFDTMVYLHYKSFDELSLVDILGPPPHTILVPRITLRELDKHKNTHPSARIRERARKILKKIEYWAAGEEVRPGISLEFLASAHTVDYQSLGLDPHWNDDVLIASVLQYRTEHPDEGSVMLVTQDSGPRMMASQFGVPVLELPNEYRLPAEPDPLEVENRELRRTILELQQATPKLAISFEGSEEEPKNHATFILTSPPDPDPMEREIKQKIVGLKAKFPKYPLPHTASDNRLPLVKIASVDPIPESEYKRYNSGVDQYLREHEACLRDTWEALKALKRSIHFRIEIWNTGTSPAEDVDLLLHFPSGFRLCLEDDLPNAPKKPNPPLKPRTMIQIASDNIIRDPYIPNFALPDLRRPSSFSIKRTQSYDVRDHFHRIKHGERASLPELFLTFDSYESAASFSCRYTIRPANLVRPIEGDLHFIIEKE